MLRFIKSKDKSKLLFQELVKELNKNTFDEKKVLKLLKPDININELDEKGRNILFDLSKKRKIEAIKLLLKHGLDINIEDNFGKTVLNEAINQGDGIMIRFLLEHGVSINHVNKSYRTVCHDVALEAKEKIFKILMIKDPDLTLPDAYERTALFDAVEGGSIEILKEIVNNIPEEEINKTDINGQTALFNAVLKEDSSIARFLINYGTDVNIVDKNRQNVLFNAVILGVDNLELIELLIKKGINLDQQDTLGLTIVDEILKLLSFIKNPTEDLTSKYRFVNQERNYLKLTSVLMEYDLPLNRPNKEGKTLLYREVENRNYEALDFLLSAGANINMPDINGRTVLFDAIYDGLENINMIEYLIDKGANIDHEDYEERTIIDELVEIILIQQNGKEKRSRKHLDIKKDADYLGLLKRLLSNKPKINRQKSNGRTIIFDLVNYKNFELLKLFLNSDLDANIEDNELKTPMSMMIEDGLKLKNPKEREQFFERLTFLLKYRTNVNAIDKEGRTVLHKAVIADDLEVVEKLISSKKLDFNIKDKQGRTALHHTQWKGNVKMARLLIASGANPNEPDGAGYTLLNYAAILGHTKLVQLLISYGVLMYNKNKKSPSVTKVFLEKEENLDKLLQGNITDMNMRNAIIQVIDNLKKEIHSV